MVSNATIYDVAARAGVSISTVSHALNRPDRLTAQTLARVMQAIDELGYIPKDSAISRARKGVGRIGVIAPLTTYESFRRRLSGVLATAAHRAIEVVVWDQESAASTTSPLLSTIPVTRRLDGLLIMGLPLDDQVVQRLTGSGLPTILVDSTHPELSSVNVDDVHGGHLIGTHLIERGHTRITVIAEQQRSTAYLSQAQQRRTGIEKALAEAGLPAENLQLVAAPSADVAGGRRATAQLLDSGVAATALVGHHDELAAGILAELRHRGLDVPGDYAVVGYDDGPLADALGLTTVRQPLEASGRIAAEMLFDALISPQPLRQTALALQLQHRDTT